MGRLLSFGKILDCFCLSSSSSYCSSCFCTTLDINGDHEYDYDNNDDNHLEKNPLIPTDDKSSGQLLRLKDVVSGHQTLAFQLKPKTVVLRVSMHCNGCARQVEKHVAKLDGVSSYEVDLESKRVVVIGDILPFQVLESVSRVKYAQLLNSTAQ